MHIKSQKTNIHIEIRRAALTNMANYGSPPYKHHTINGRAITAIELENTQQTNSRLAHFDFTYSVTQSHRHFLSSGTKSNV